MNSTIDHPERVTFHKSQGLWQALQNAGKKEWARQAKNMSYQLYAYEVAVRRLKEQIVTGAPKEDLLKVIDSVSDTRAAQ